MSERDDGGPDLRVGLAISTLPDGGKPRGHVGDAAVLLVRYGDQVAATGATCTHPGAPIAKGLAMGKTIRRPWHHAGFSLTAGEALRAPASGPLARYEAMREGNRVVGAAIDSAEAPREDGRCTMSVMRTRSRRPLRSRLRWRPEIPGRDMANLHPGSVCDGRGRWKAALAAGTVLALTATASPAAAGCSDSPGEKVVWKGCSKQQVMLGGENLSGGNFAGAVLSSADFSKAKLVGAKFTGAEVSYVRFAGADLSHADLTKAIGWQTDFRGANLAEAALSGAQLIRATFAGAKMEKANLSKAELNRSSFGKADVTGGDLSKAELPRVDFAGARLAHVDFSYSNLGRAKLGGLDLAGVKLGGAYLFLTQIGGADLTHAEGLKQDQLDEACGDPKTKLPAGLKAPSSWPCKGDVE